jgi:Asp-tRNA(Asn)/Glu-tRNA(Gln) amidotransferase A subunit family amidase
VLVGTDTGCSMITSNTHAALFAIRLTMKLTSQQEITSLSHVFGSVGRMAKSVVDIANLLDHLVDPPFARGASHS